MAWVVPPLYDNLSAPGDEGSDDETDSITSTVGAAVDDRERRKAAMIRCFAECLGEREGPYAIPLLNNKMNANRGCVKKLPSDPHLRLWVESWNHTSERLSPHVLVFMRASRHFPDGGFAGPRAVKQLFEVLVLVDYVRRIHAARVDGLVQEYERVKAQLSNAIMQLSIAADHPPDGGAPAALQARLREAHAEHRELTLGADERIPAATARVVEEFRKITIDANTIKRKENLQQGALQGFLRQPTVEGYELVLQLFLPIWEAHLCEQNRNFEDVRAGYASRAPDDDAPAAAADGAPPALKRRRTSDIRSTSEAEKAAIRLRDGNVCRGLPAGLAVACNTPGAPLPSWELEIDHAIPLRIQEADGDAENRRCLCTRCHNFKTKFIDPLLVANASDAEVSSAFKTHNALPEWAVNQINLSVRVR